MRIPAAILLILLGTGCGTISNLGGGNLFYKGPKIYGGIRQNSATMRQGGRHEPYTPIAACMDMPFSLVLDTIVLPVTIPIALWGEDDPEDTYNEIYRKILKSETLSVRFSAVKETDGNPQLAANGTLVLKKGNKVRLEMMVRFEDKQFPIRLVSDGSMMLAKVGAAPAPPVKAPPDLEKWYRDLLFTVGVLDNSWLPPGNPLDLARGEAVKTTIRYRYVPGTDIGPYIFFFNPKGKPRAGTADPAVKTIVSEFEIDQPRFNGGVTFAYDPSSLAITWRSQTSMETYERVRETYEQFRYGEELADDLFQLRD